MIPYLQYLPMPLQPLAWRAHPLDGKLLLFERDNGLNALLEGDETAHLRRIAPRTLLVAITNACNLTCHFCYRDLESRSLWRYETLIDFCHEIDEWGVLEVAFGGGEPMLFPRWTDFIDELHATTNLCLNFTTNGMLLTDEFLGHIAGKYGQIRLSIYEDNHYAETIKRLVANNARFGINWLITPDELDGIERKFAGLLALGVRDFLLLSYKGSDPTMHFRPEDYARFTEFLNRVHQQLGTTMTLKLDVCWGDMLPGVPRLFEIEDCGAGDDFLSITSDKHVKVCSFHHAGIPFDTVDDLRRIWERQRQGREAARIGGCGRLPERGLSEGANNAYIPLAAI